MNKVVLVGRLVRDPEMQQTISGINYIRFTIAVNRPFSKEKSADFIPCIAWRNQSNFISTYLKKGALISLEGRFSSSNYQNNDGKTIYVYEVTVENVQGLESMQSQAARQQEQLKESNVPTNIVESSDEEKPKKEDESNNDVPWELDL